MAKSSKGAAPGNKGPNVSQAAKEEITKLIQRKGGVKGLAAFHEMTGNAHQRWNARSLSQVIRRANGMITLSNTLNNMDGDNGKATGKRKSSGGAAAAIMAAGITGKGLKTREETDGKCIMNCVSN